MPTFNCDPFLRRLPKYCKNKGADSFLFLAPSGHKSERQIRHSPPQHTAFPGDARLLASRFPWYSPLSTLRCPLSTSGGAKVPGMKSALENTDLRIVFPFLLATLLVAAALGTPLAADDLVEFEKDVWPILEASCVSCHGAVEQFSNLRLDSAERIMKGGDLGKVLVPGEPGESPMYVRVSLAPDDLDLMPVEGDPLTEEQTEIIRRWIEEGADFGGWTGQG